MDSIYQFMKWIYLTLRFTEITTEGWNPFSPKETVIPSLGPLKTLSSGCLQMGSTLCNLHGETHQWFVWILQWHSSQTSVLQETDSWGLHCLLSQAMAVVACETYVFVPLSSSQHPWTAGVPSHLVQVEVGS